MRTPKRSCKLSLASASTVPGFPAASKKPMLSSGASPLSKGRATSAESASSALPERAPSFHTAWANDMIGASPLESSARFPQNSTRSKVRSAAKGLSAGFGRSVAEAGGRATMEKSPSPRLLPCSENRLPDSHSRADSSPWLASRYPENVAPGASSLTSAKSPSGDEAKRAPPASARIIGPMAPSRSANVVLTAMRPLLPSLRIRRRRTGRRAPQGSTR